MGDQFQLFIDQLQNQVAPENRQSAVSLTFNLFLGGTLALYLRWLFRRFSTSASDADSIARVFPLLTLITTAVIAVVKSSLALSLGLVGALSIVRFRAAIKEPEELVYLFLCIAVGLCLGAEQPLFAVCLVLVASGFVVGIGIFGKNRQQRMMLTVSGATEQLMDDSETGVLKVIDGASTRCRVQRVDIENGRAQLRVMLSSVKSDDVNRLVKDLHRQLPGCDISYVNVNTLV